MPTPVSSVLVVIASPGDAAEERAVVRNSLNDWSVRIGYRQAVVALPWLYERHAVPTMGGRSQSLINAQAVDQADVVVAFFDSRLGTSTGIDVSGTAEEIRRAVKLGKPVHVYFSEEDLLHNVDIEQFSQLTTFRKELETEGLLGRYTDPNDLARQVQYAVQSDIDEHGWGQKLSAPKIAGAKLIWKHDHRKEQAGFDKRGKEKYRTVSNALVVRNDSEVAAENLTFTLTPLPPDGQHLYSFDGPEEPLTLHGESEQRWTMIMRGRTSLQIDAQWEESGVPRQHTRTITTS